MTREELFIEVKTRMDEITPEGQSLPFDDFIDTVLDESARELLEASPLHILTPEAIPVAGTIVVDNKAYIPVPANYIKLYEVKYPLWKKSIRRAITPADPEYKIQENEYTRGGYARPCVALLHTSLNGGPAGKYLECSKVVDGTSAPVALYIKTDLPENLDNKFSNALSWLCVSKLMVIMEDSNKAKLAYEQYTNALNLLAVN